MLKKIIGGILVLLLLLTLGYFFIARKDPCASITDSSQQRDCYINQAINSGDISYCKLDYYTQKCLEEADPKHEADKATVSSFCEAVSDSSKRNECLGFVNENY